MKDEISFFFSEIADRFTENDLYAITECYTYPLAVYFGETIQLLENKNEVLDLIFNIRGSSVQRGVLKFTTKIKSISELSDNRFRVIVEWHYLGVDGQTIAKDDVRCFIRFLSGRPKIELMEFLDARFPGFQEALRRL